ncbi:hypothetical protein RCL1_002742 [Eukaryota sp. TZLM3-RCL]
MTSSSAELIELQRRYHLLEADRRAFYETSQHTLNQNKETADLLKEQVRQLRQDLLQLQKARGSAESASAALERELREAQTSAHKQKARRDLLQHEIARKETTLTSLQDQLADLQKEIQGALPSDADPSQERIKSLEADLDKVTIKYNESTGIKSTYEQICKRLGEERLGYQNEIQQLETLIKQKEEDVNQVVTILNDAKHAKVCVKRQLEQAKGRIEAQRETRDAALQEKKMQLERKMELTLRLQERERRLAETELSTHEGQKASNQIESSSISQVTSTDDYDLITTFEEAFEKLKEVTGVVTPNEVIDKFSSQQQVTDSLSALVSEAEQRIVSLEQSRNELHAKLDAVKYSGGVSSSSSKQQIEQFEAKLADAKAKHDEIYDKSQASFKLLVEVKVAIESLVDRCSVLKLPGNCPAIFTSKPDTLTDEAAVKALTEVMKRLIKVGELLVSEGVAVEEIGTGSFLSQVDANMVSMRVSVDDGDEEEELVSEDEDTQIVEKVLDRKTLKQQSEELDLVTGSMSRSTVAKV